MITDMGIGDVCAVDTSGLAGDLIRLGSELEGKPAPASHVVVVHHVDKRGRWWGVAGQPGGVGWADMLDYTTGPLAPHSNSNAVQPRTTAQRALLAKTAAGLLGVQYDWVGGIGGDALDDVHLAELADLVDDWWGWGDRTGLAPAHVVCSSMAAWVQRHVGLAAPAGAAELVQPADWWRFNEALTA
jgi:hypothetical protein